MTNVAESETPRRVCCVCGKFIEPEGSWLDGHNAEPVAKGRCCADCNRQHVIPARLLEIQRRGAR